MKKLSHSYHWIIQPLLVVGILVFGFVGAMSFSMFKEEPRKAERETYAPLVRVLETEVTTQQVIVDGNGTLEARTRINIVPQVGGRITYIHPNLRAGGTFKAKETLIEIERIDYELAVTQNEAQVAAARTTLELEQAEADAAREEWITLNPNKQVPTLVGREPQIAEAKAEVKAAEARLAQARLDLQRTRIAMPFAGRVVDAMIDVGEVLAANQQVGVVYSSEKFEIPVPLEVDQLAWIEVPNKSAGIEGSAVNIHVRIGDANYDLPGRVTRIESELEELSRFARVVVTLLPKDIPAALKEKVIPGLFVDVSILSQQLAQVTSMPRATLRQGNIIWTVDNNNHLQFVKPEIVYKSEDEILVRDLDNGTQVIMSNLEVVTEGMQVRITEGS